MAANTAPARVEVSALLSASDVERIDKNAALGARFKNFRQSAYARALAHPFPTSSHELWRYTKPERFDWKKLLEAQAETIRLGVPAAGKALLPEVELLSGAVAAEHAYPLLESLLGEKGSDLSSDAVSAFQLATVSSFALLTVKKNSQFPQPIYLSHLFPPQKVGAASTLLVISIEPNASAVIIEDLEGACGLYAPRVEVAVGQNAALTFCSVQNLSDDSTYFARHRFHTARDARLKSVHLALGSRTSRVDLDLRMHDEGASADLLAAYIADGTRLTDFHPTQYHLAPNCRSEFFSKGVATKRAHAVYYGYIKVAEGAQKTDAYQTNRNLLLSEHARADSIPNLEIKANDVRCSHGASVSHVNAEDMFYLQTRGLPRPVAEEILVEGFLEDLLTRVPDARLHDRMSTLVMERLHRGR